MGGHESTLFFSYSSQKRHFYKSRALCMFMHLLMFNAFCYGQFSVHCLDRAELWWDCIGNKVCAPYNLAVCSKPNQVNLLEPVRPHAIGSDLMIHSVVRQDSHVCSANLLVRAPMRSLASLMNSSLFSVVVSAFWKSLQVDQSVSTQQQGGNHQLIFFFPAIASP